MQAVPTLVVLGLLAAGTALWIWTLADVLSRESGSAYRRGTQLLWVLVIAVTHAVGAVLYLVLGRPARAAR